MEGLVSGTHATLAEIARLQCNTHDSSMMAQLDLELTTGRSDNPADQWDSDAVAAVRPLMGHTGKLEEHITTLHTSGRALYAPGTVSLRTDLQGIAAIFLDGESMQGSAASAGSDGWGNLEVASPVGPGRYGYTQNISIETGTATTHTDIGLTVQDAAVVVAV